MKFHLVEEQTGHLTKAIDQDVGEKHRLFSQQKTFPFNAN
jgi:hypothetical protein